MASPKTPSASRMVPTRCCTRIRRSSGVMTVGPVTMTSEPNRAAVVHGQSISSLAAIVAPTPVISAPTVTMRRMALPSRFSRRRSS